jgi:hypothetical protein
MEEETVFENKYVKATFLGLCFGFLTLLIQFCTDPPNSCKEINTRLPSHAAMLWCRTMFPEEQTCIVNCSDDRETAWNVGCSVRPGNRDVIGVTCNVSTGCVVSTSRH